MRKATIEDAPRILEMMVDYYLERKPKLDLNVTKVRKFLEVALTHPVGICYIADNGFIMGEVGPLWFGDTIVGNSVAWYVKPEARKGMLAFRLFRAFERGAKEKGAKFVKFDLETRKRILVKEIGHGIFSRNHSCYH